MSAGEASVEQVDLVVAGAGAGGMAAALVANDAASVMRGSYPGPGTTLGPAVVFAYRIGRHAAGRITE